MAKLVWSEDFSVGVAKLDEDHKNILRLINTLVDLGEVSSSSEEIGDALTAMTNYANRHFEREEAHLRSIGFPDIERHAREHMVFGETTAVDFCLQVLDGGGGIPERVLAYLRHWWVDHILENETWRTRSSSRTKAKEAIIAAASSSRCRPKSL